jgi:hypothetical protein
MLNSSQREAADAAALVVLNHWLAARSHNEVTMEEAAPDRQSVLY